ncbi:PGF-CTERM-anchored ABC transporter substrate-binding protein [Halococcus sediminicola]|uniref:PGF-CTERM-anchored ABC transporter substrate-binding protein n=1 Tax=Halococcus sediminicola TaxID=1264579 RepID=UPI000A63BCFE|nr:PGF-CTERM-anchored ABC transporter substrate-binding protein [Halococcus sediminicola]
MFTKAASAAMVLLVVVAGVGPAAATAEMGSQPAQTADCSFPVTATDATGTEVTVEDEPQKVVALGASTAQTLWDIGAKEKVVGIPVNPTTAYLNGSTERTDIYQADEFSVATEEVVGLEPDLVLAPSVIPNESVAALRDAGLTVYKFEFGNSLSGIYEKTNQTGKLVGACEGARETVEATKTRVNAIEQAIEGEERPSVLYAQGGGFVAGNGTFIHEIIEAAGGENLAADVGIEGYERISNETVAAQDPDWIIASDASLVPAGEPYASTTALREDQVIALNTTLLSQPAPRVVIPMTEIARNLHPEAMQRANLSNTTTIEQVVEDNSSNASATSAETGTAVATDGGTPADEPTADETERDENTVDNAGSGATGETTGTATGGTETSSGSGPGFGVWAAVVALLGAALLARRT